jgi:hypothetical protein
MKYNIDWYCDDCEWLGDEYELDIFNSGMMDCGSEYRCPRCRSGDIHNVKEIERKVKHSKEIIANWVRILEAINAKRNK